TVLFDTVVLSLGSSPEIISKTSAMSSTRLAIGPICSMLLEYEIKPYLLTRPYVGFNPTTEQKLAGLLTDPPVSEPREIIHSIELTDAPLPPEEPPGTYSVFHGFLVGPK